LFDVRPCVCLCAVDRSVKLVEKSNVIEMPTVTDSKLGTDASRKSSDMVP